MSTTITKLEQQTKDGKPNGFKVTLADNTFGYLVEKDSDKGLKEGDTVNYTAETPTGKTYKKLTIHKEGQSAPSSQSIPPQPQRPAIHVGAGKSIEECKVMCLIAVFEAVYEKMKNESQAVETLSMNFKSVAPLLYDEVDAIFGKK